MTTKILLIDDDVSVLRPTKTYLEDVGGFECEATDKFADAEGILVSEQFDIVITDYKDNINSVEDAGKKILEKLQQTKFTPLIIYTGYPGSIDGAIKGKQNNFFKIIEKGLNEKELLRTINDILESKEYKIKKEIEKEIETSLEENFREYFWDIVHNHWEDFKDLDEKTLKNALLRKILKNSHPKYLEGEKINPIEFYEHPVSSLEISSGMILTKDGRFFVCVNNDCDLSVRAGACKISKICLLEIKDYSSLVSPGSTPKQKEENFRILNNNHLSHQERRFFFPKTFFFRGGYVDFDDIILIEPVLVEDGKIKLNSIGAVVVKINPPFLHRFISNFSRYYNRFGTPEIDIA